MPTTTTRRQPTSYAMTADARRLIAERAKAWRRSQSSYLEELVRAEAGEESTIPLRPFPTYTPTAAERRAIEKGRAEIRRGDYYTLDEFRAILLGAPRSQERAKKNRPRTTSRTRATRRRS